MPTPPSSTQSTSPNPVSPQEQQEFNTAIRAYQVSSGRMFPTWSEVLEVLRSLDYEKPEHHDC